MLDLDKYECFIKDYDDLLDEFKFFCEVFDSMLYLYG